MKSYLSVFQASDHLQEMAQQRALPLAQVLELSKCEKKLGAARTRKLIDGVCKGELVQKDLARLRNKPERKTPSEKAVAAPTTHKLSRTRLHKSGDALLKALVEDPQEVGYQRSCTGVCI